MSISLQPNIRESFYKFISLYPQSALFFNRLEAYDVQVLLFGGTVRAYFENDFNKKPRDIDIVISSQNNFNLINFLKTYRYDYKVNKYGGYKLTLDSLNIDIWSIERTWAFKENIVKFEDLKDLNKTVFLNTDAIFYNLNSKILYDEGFLDLRKNKEIDIVLENNPFPELNLVKALYYKNEYDYRFSNKLDQYFKKWISNKKDSEEAKKELNSIAYKRYGKEVMR
jgi:hypothetical protein